MKKILFVIAFSVASLCAGSLQETQRNLQKFKQECDANNVKSCLKLLELRGIREVLKDEEYKQYAEKAANLCNDAKTCLEASETWFDDEFQAKLLMRVCDEFNHIETCKKLPSWIDNKIIVSYLPIKYRSYMLHYRKKSCEMGYAEACISVATAHKNGNERYSVEQNMDESLKYSNKACDLNDSRGCYSVAKYYEKIEKEKPLLERNYTQVLEYYKKKCVIGGGSRTACGDYYRVKELWEGK